MPSDTRQRMAEGAAQLLAVNGLEGTSFAAVLELTGAPRGSIYHHFPAGKDQLVAAALSVAAAQCEAALEQVRGRPAAAVTKRFLDLWGELLERGHLRAGCAVLAVTVAAETPALRARAGAIFTAWTDQLTDLLVAGGLRRRDAVRFAALLVSASEGAVALSRGQGERTPFDHVSAMLLAEVRRLTAGAG